MFQIGDLVVYGSTGVCRVEEICPLNPKEADKLFYHLVPLHQDGAIYAPVDSEKVSIRPIISADQADALIDSIPTIHPEICRAPTTQALAQYYQTTLRSHNCHDLVEMMLSIYAKRRQAQAMNRHLGMVDERYMKQGERLLFGELSAALHIELDEVQNYIASRVDLSSLYAEQKQ